MSVIPLACPVGLKTAAVAPAMSSWAGSLSSGILAPSCTYGLCLSPSALPVDPRQHSMGRWKYRWQGLYQALALSVSSPPPAHLLPSLTPGFPYRAGSCCSMILPPIPPWAAPPRGIRSPGFPACATSPRAAPSQHDLLRCFSIFPASVFMECQPHSGRTGPPGPEQTPHKYVSAITEHQDCLQDPRQCPRL